MLDFCIYVFVCSSHWFESGRALTEQDDVTVKLLLNRLFSPHKTLTLIVVNVVMNIKCYGEKPDF